MRRAACAGKDDDGGLARAVVGLFGGDEDAAAGTSGTVTLQLTVWEQRL